MISAGRTRHRPIDRDPDIVGRVIGAAYEAVSSPQGWQDFADALSAAIPSARISFFIHGRVPGIPSILAQAGWNPIDLRDYRDHFARVNPFLKLAHHVPIGVPETSQGFARRMGMDVEGSEYFNDYVRPRRRNWNAIALVLERNERSMTALSVVSDELLSTAETRSLCRLFAGLAPHMQRALALDRRLAGIAPAGRAATAVLDRLAAAIVVLNDDASLHLANRAAETLLQTGDGLTLSREGQLRGQDPVVTAQLGLAIERAIAAHRLGAVDQGTSVTLRRGPGRQPLSALVLPMPRDGSRFGYSGDEGAAAMVVIAGTDQIRASVAGWLQERFRLTPAEQRLVECLATGMRLEEAAGRLAISRETARTRLKQVMIKTECDRQSELVRLVLSAPGSLLTR